MQPDLTHLSGEEPNQCYYCSLLRLAITYSIYASLLILLVPVQLNYATWYPFSFGPIFISAFASLYLFAIATFYIFYCDKETVTKNKVIFVIFVWGVHTAISNGLVFFGYWHSIANIGIRGLSGIAQYSFMFSVLLSLSVIKWQEEDFELFIKILLAVCLLWGVEAIVTYYFGGNFFGLASIKGSNEFFDSGITSSLNIVSRISVIGFWSCLYFYFRYKSFMFVLFSLVMVLVVTATQTKAPILSISIGAILFVVLSFVMYICNYNLFKKKFNIFLTILILTVSSLATIINFENRKVDIDYMSIIDSNRGADLDSANPIPMVTRSYANTFIHASLDRVYQYIRAIEVFLHNPLGYGAGIGYHMMFSSEIDDNIIKRIYDHDLFLTYRQHATASFLSSDIQQQSVTKTHSLHSTILNYILDYGIFALFFLFFYFRKIFYALSLLFKCLKTRYDDKETILLGILIIAHISLILSLLTVPGNKFYALWVLAVLWVFLAKKVQSISTRITE